MGLLNDSELAKAEFYNKCKNKMYGNGKIQCWAYGVMEYTNANGDSYEVFGQLCANHNSRNAILATMKSRSVTYINGIGVDHGIGGAQHVASPLISRYVVLRHHVGVPRVTCKPKSSVNGLG